MKGKKNYYSGFPVGNWQCKSFKIYFSQQQVQQQLHHPHAQQPQQQQEQQLQYQKCPPLQPEKLILWKAWLGLWGLNPLRQLPITTIKTQWKNNNNLTLQFKRVILNQIQEAYSKWILTMRYFLSWWNKTNGQKKL